MRLVKDKRVSSVEFRVLSWVSRVALASAFVLGLSLSALAVNYPERPDPPRLVNDMAGMLSADEVQQLENKLVAYDDSTSTQITIVTINSLNGEDASQYAPELGQKWGVGRKGKDNGVVVLISKTDHQIFIAPGRGVEEYLPDAICKRIVENTIKPAFRAGNYYEGLNSATDEMMARLSGNFVNNDKGDGGNLPFPLIVIIIMVIIFVISFIFRNRGGGGGTTYSRGGFGGPVIWGGGFGGGGFGGGGGGGFGGFGGGSFGGGGAGGSW